MYDYNDIQRMITECRNDADLRKRVKSHFKGMDFDAISYVFDEGYYEAFDRFDSAVCEDFITAYEKETGVNA